MTSKVAETRIQWIPRIVANTLMQTESHAATGAVMSVSLGFDSSARKGEYFQAAVSVALLAAMLFRESAAGAISDASTLINHLFVLYDGSKSRIVVIAQIGVRIIALASIFHPELYLLHHSLKLIEMTAKGAAALATKKWDEATLLEATSFLLPAAFKVRKMQGYILKNPAMAAKYCQGLTGFSGRILGKA